MRTPIRIIKAGEIKENYSMTEAIDTMYKAFSAVSSGEGFVPQHFISRLPSGEMVMILKPAYVEKEKQVSVKFLTQREGGPVPGVPTIQGIILLINSETGEIFSIMDGEYITALRTGAASGLATRFFARESARAMAIFGCGAQGRTQVEAVLCERDINKVLVYDKNKNQALSFAREMEEKYQVEMRYTSDTSRLNEVDIICTATDSTQPLFKSSEIKKGVHINAIGSFQAHMQELDPHILKSASVYFDKTESCLRESGDLIRAMSEGVFSKNDIAGELGDLCLGKSEGRTSEEEITVFKSVGVAIQDFMVAGDIYTSSLKKSFGTDFRIFE
jgi:ornithine cyclodeaminase/alanine dehydrogenase